MEIIAEKFKKIKDEAEIFYKKIGKVHCPYLKDDVYFNSKGLEHLKFKERNKARSSQDQYVRLRLIKLAPEIIRSSHTLQEFYETKRFEQQNINSRWENRMIAVTYYGFIAIINNARIKIIIKEVFGGNKFFWSLIPFWRYYQKNSGDDFIGNKKILHAGDMDKD